MVTMTNRTRDWSTTACICKGLPDPEFDIDCSIHGGGSHKHIGGVLSEMTDRTRDWSTLTVRLPPELRPRLARYMELEGRRSANEAITVITTRFLDLYEAPQGADLTDSEGST